MFKKFLKITILPLCIICLLTGCGEETVAPEPVEEVPKYATKENLTVTYASKTKANTLVFYLKNKDENLAHDVSVEVEFWKANEGKDDTLVGSSKSSFMFVKSGTTVVGLASVGKREYDYYKIFIDMDETTDSTKKKVFVYDDVIVEDSTNLNPTKEELEAGVQPDNAIMITLKNKGEEKISVIDVGVVFYKDNEVVGYSKKSKENLKSMTKATVRVEFPVGNSYSDKVEFDSYRIYVNQAYRNKY